MRYFFVLPPILLALAACGGTASGPEAIAGKVVDDSGVPVAGASVSIMGGASVTTAADGTFSLSGVPTTYDLLVVSTVFDEAVLYRGLTRRDPFVSLGGESGLVSQATIAGQLSGGAGYPGAATQKSAVTVVLDNGNANTIPVGSSGSFTNAPSWRGQGATGARLEALQWQVDGSGLPTTFTGWGTRDGLTLADGTALTGQDIALTDIAEGTLTTSITLPAGYTLSSKRLTADHMTVVDDSSSSTSLSWVTPSFPGVTLDLVVVARGDGGSSFAGKTLAAPTDTASLTFTPVPVPTAPVDGATGISAGTECTWGAVPGATYVVAFVVSGGPQIRVITTTPDASLPDLAGTGLVLPGSSSVTWFVVAMAGGTPDVLASDEVGPIYGLSRSAFMRFTTAP